MENAARVAELVDAADSKSAVRKNVLVRFQSRARYPLIKGFFYAHFLLKTNSLTRYTFFSFPFIY